jgi:hypothetical protein
MDLPADRGAERAAHTVAAAPAITYISRLALALMTTASVASLRAAPTETEEID